MSNLAIRGHLTRGKEVIEILEMLGGKNPEGYVGIDVEEYYIIEEGDITQAYDWNNHITFTLEEFLKEFPYKVGDRVDTTYNNRIYTGEVKAMRWCSEDKCVLYQVDFIHNLRVENILPRNNDVIKEVMEEINIDRIGFNGDKAKLILPDGYEFKTEGKEVYIAKKKLQYPKTYEECCEVLGKTKSYQSVSGYKTELLEDFQKLLICRDAYWKIVGDWKPTWSSKAGIKYGICVDCNRTMYCTSLTGNIILIFPTEEMRDAFYENFKDLIEQCKELL